MMTGPKPIFIHSLFRAGSTYLFEVFRRATNSYWCYQEPENEILLHLTNDPTSLICTTDNLNSALRHPKLSKPYLAEFIPFIGDIRANFKKEFAYDTFFLTEGEEHPQLHGYLYALIERAPNRPVLQFCRSTGRIRWMKRHFGGTHLFLWRNPWDQWWSYKVTPYFDTANMLILNAHTRPPIFEEICREIGLEEFHSKVIDDELSHFDSRPLDATQSYLIFYSLWLYAMHEGLETADAVLSIDSLSASPDYRIETLARLEKLGVTGLDFSDCSIHHGWFGGSDTVFFRNIEQRVHAIFGHYGYNEEKLNRIIRMPDKTHDNMISKPDMQALREDLERSKKLIRQLESDKAELKKVIVNLREESVPLRAVVADQQAKLESIYNSLLWKIITPIREPYWKLRSIYRTSRTATNRKSTAPIPSSATTAAQFPSETLGKQHCPICFEGTASAFGNQDWLIRDKHYRLLICQACGSAFTSPRPDDAILQGLYRTSFDYRWYQDHYDAKLRDCRMRIQEYGSRLGKRVLDFGGGVGYFSKAASEAGLESVTYDPYVNSALPAGKRWDSVVALHVLEHSNDLDRTLCQIKSLLAPRGRVIIAVPNFAGLGYQKLGMRWVWAQPPLMHVFHFTATGLKALLKRHGFVEFEMSFHERWDANLYCDLEHVERFRSWDAHWGFRPFNAFPPYRRWIAARNARYRFEGLLQAMRDHNPQRDIYSELQVTASLGQ